LECSSKGVSSGCLLTNALTRGPASRLLQNLQDFLGDLRNHPTDQDKDYFYGTILLSKVGGGVRARLKSYDLYDIVDGQQRLTTACIFIGEALRRLSGEHELVELVNEYQKSFIRDGFDIRKFHTIPEDEPFFESIFLYDHERHSETFDRPSQRRLFEDKQYFNNVLRDMSLDDIIRLLTVLDKARVLVHAVNTDAEATQIFELQNDRGKPLTNLEALKSFMMHGLYLHAGENTDSDLSIVQNHFAAIYQAAERMEDRYDAREEDQLLSDHCIAFEPWRTVANADGWSQPKELVKELLRSEPDGLRRTWIKHFSQRLRDTFDMALQILDARDRYRSISLGGLTGLGQTAVFWPLLLKCWSFDRTPDRAQFNSVVRSIESFAFRRILAGRRADAGRSELRRLARDFAGDFRALIEAVDSMRNDASIVADLRRNLDSEYLYDWGHVITYLLWRYENHLRERPGQQMPRFQWDTLSLPERPAVKYEKDHIEPKNPENPTLGQRVKWLENDEESKPFDEVCLHRLGNLVLDTVSAGSSKSDRCFVERNSSLHRPLGVAVSTGGRQAVRLERQ
jgi:hypothetical protein